MSTLVILFIQTAEISDDLPKLYAKQEQGSWIYGKMVIPSPILRTQGHADVPWGQYNIQSASRASGWKTAWTNAFPANGINVANENNKSMLKTVTLSWKIIMSWLTLGNFPLATLIFPPPGLFTFIIILKKNCRNREDLGYEACHFFTIKFLFRWLLKSQIYIYKHN